MVAARTIFLVSVNLVNNFLGFIYMLNCSYYFITYYVTSYDNLIHHNLDSVAQSAGAVC
jgi:hypothetical protein